MKTNEYIVHDDYIELIVRSNTHGTFSVKIDEDDYERCKELKWCIMKTYHRKNEMFYIRSNSSGRCVLLHRFIFGEIEKGMIVDHENGDTMDNRKKNLRQITQQQNCINRKHENDDTKSGYRGVLWYTHTKTPKWVAHMKLNGKRIHLGRFENLEDAIAARKEAEEKYFGEYARED